MLAAAPTPPAQEDAPVALTADFHGLGRQTFRLDDLDNELGMRLIPGTETLYYTRPDDKLRKAAEEYSALTEMANLHFQSEEHAQQHLDAKWKLRAALRDNYGNATETQ